MIPVYIDKSVMTYNKNMQMKKEATSDEVSINHEGTKTGGPLCPGDGA
jgi:hypothetical protein